MTERPILFSGPMVKAILDGRKSQTRRVVKNAPGDGWHADRRGGGYAFVASAGTPSMPITLPCAIGDRLWVREAHAFVPSSAYRHSTGVWQTEQPDDPDRCAVYREGWVRCWDGPWRPSIHMPRWASRITLLVTDVRVERLQDISDDDAAAEGVRPVAAQPDPPGAHRVAFRALWDDISGGKPGAIWNDDPWVVAISFEVEPTPRADAAR